MQYFVFADVHGDYDALMTAVEKYKYDMNDSNHTLVSLGDNFGRATTGEGSLGVWKYLTDKNHKNKPICIKGNHESILLNIFKKNKLSQTDLYNGEDKTIASFANCSTYVATLDPEYIQIAAKTGVEEWIEQLPWYFETNGYVFTHGWIPPYLTWDTEHNPLEACNDHDWDRASWSQTPYLLSYLEGLKKEGFNKALVVGHWTASYFYSYYNKVKNYYGHMFHAKKLNIYFMDCTTILSHNIEMLVVNN